MEKTYLEQILEERVVGKELTYGTDMVEFMEYNLDKEYSIEDMEQELGADYDYYEFAIMEDIFDEIEDNPIFKVRVNIETEEETFKIVSVKELERIN